MENPDPQWVGAGNQNHEDYDFFSSFFLPIIWCIFIQTLRNVTVHRVAVTDGAGLGEDVEAAEVWVPNGHRQVKMVPQRCPPPTHPLLLEMSMDGSQREGALHKGRQTTPPPSCFTPAASEKLTDQSGHEGHPVPATKFRLHDVIIAEKSLSHPCCINIRHYPLSILSSEALQPYIALWNSINSCSICITVSSFVMVCGACKTMQACTVG